MLKKKIKAELTLPPDNYEWNSLEIRSVRVNKDGSSLSASAGKEKVSFKASAFLDRQYTVFGKVIKGMEFVDLIKRGEGGNGEVSDPDKIISLTSQ